MIIPTNDFSDFFFFFSKPSSSSSLTKLGRQSHVDWSGML